MIYNNRMSENILQDHPQAREFDPVKEMRRADYLQRDRRQDHGDASSSKRWNKAWDWVDDDLRRRKKKVVLQDNTDGFYDWLADKEDQGTTIEGDNLAEPSLNDKRPSYEAPIQETPKLTGFVHLDAERIGAMSPSSIEELAEYVTEHPELKKAILKKFPDEASLRAVLGCESTEFGNPFEADAETYLGALATLRTTKMRRCSDIYPEDRDDGEHFVAAGMHITDRP